MDSSIHGNLGGKRILPGYVGVKGLFGEADWE